MLYRHVKQMIWDHTTYFICANISVNLIVKKHLIVRNDAAEISPLSDRIIGIMVLENNFKVERIPNFCIIHYICILPKFLHKGYGSYLMGKSFSSDKELKHIAVYTVTRLMH